MEDPRMTQLYPPAPPAAADGPAPGVEFASRLARLIGYLIDGFIMGAAVLVLGLVLGAVIGLAGEAGRSLIAGLGFILYFVILLAIMFLYFPYFWQKSGQTPGMTVVKIKVVRDDDGGPIGWGIGVIRLFGFFVSQFVFYIGFLWVFVDKRRRGWFDLMAGTCVIKA
jgi:uncharacterized RDD family membrane protein YckC